MCYIVVSVCICTCVCVYTTCVCIRVYTCMRVCAVCGFILRDAQCVYMRVYTYACVRSVWLYIEGRTIFVYVCTHVRVRVRVPVCVVCNFLVRDALSVHICVYTCARVRSVWLYIEGRTKCVNMCIHMCATHRGDQTYNIRISRSISFPNRSFEWQGLRSLNWKLICNFRDSRENVFDMDGDSETCLILWQS